MNWFITLVLALAVGASSPFGVDLPSSFAGAAAPQTEQVKLLAAPEASLESQIQAWIEQLAQEEAFAAWQGASWRKFALGPGQHGWVVLVDGPDGNEIGYFIVTATVDGGYALSEYGLGAFPLFSEHTLKRAMSSDALHDEGAAFTSKASVERYYMDAMHAFWKVSEAGRNRYADAATGAWLPVDDDRAARLEKRIVPEETLSGKRLHITKQPGDPYMSLDWLDAPDASIGNWNDFIAWLDRHGEGKAMYAASTFGGALLTPIGVAGYHWWPVADGIEAPAADAPGPLRGFVALQQETLRYIPLEQLLAAGAFR